MLRIRTVASLLLVMTLCSLAPSSASAQRPGLPPRIGFKRLNLSFDNNINIFGSPKFQDFVLEVQKIRSDQDMARQQVKLALQYLILNRDRIMAGLDPLYNQVFGGFYDRTNRFFGQYTVDSSHIDRVIRTFSQIDQSLNSDTFYGYGTGNTLTSISGPILGGFDRGSRQWGYSNSDSLLKYDAYFNTGGPQPLRWDRDNNPASSLAATEPFLRRYAASNGFAFFNQRLDIYGDVQNIQRQFIGGVFLSSNTGDPSLDGNAFPRNRYTDGGLNMDPFANSGRLQPWNSGRFGGFGGGGGGFGNLFDLSDYNFNGRFTGNVDRSLRRYQLMIGSFSEYATDLDDPRGGAYHGFNDLIQLLASSQDEADFALLLGMSFDADSFAMFAEFLNGAGFNDPRKFPPRGKNGKFVPGVPMSTAAGP